MKFKLANLAIVTIFLSLFSQGCGLKMDVFSKDEIKCFLEQDSKTVSKAYPEEKIRLYDVGSADGIRMLAIERYNSLKWGLPYARIGISDEKALSFLDRVEDLAEEAKFEALRLAEKYRIEIERGGGVRRIYWYSAETNGGKFSEGVVIVSNFVVVLRDDWSANDRLFFTDKSLRYWGQDSLQPRIQGGGD